MILKLPDITDQQIITQMKAGIFNYNGIKYGSTYSEVVEVLDEHDEKDMLRTEPGEFNCEYGIEDYSVLLSFIGIQDWMKKDYVLLMINYNFLDTFLEFDVHSIKQIWGEPQSVTTDQPNWDTEGQFLVYNLRYGFTELHFNKQERLFAISYFDEKLYKKWKD